MSELRLHLAESIPLPTRPGTMWDVTGNLHRPYPRCNNCGKDYNSHGAPTDVAISFGIPEWQRHLVCPASDEAWTAFHRQRAAANVADYIALVSRELQQFTPDQQHEIVEALDRIVPTHPLDS